MSQDKTATIVRKREVRVHGYLLHTSKVLLRKGLEDEEGSFCQFMASLVFTAFTLEAYLNWLGGKIFPHWKYLERLSPKEKLAVISDQIGITIENGVRPWQTIGTLFEFRNEMAHGKPQEITSETIEPIDDDLDGKLGKAALATWERFCTSENAERAREDVERILQALHSAAKIKGDPGPLFPGFQRHELRL